MRTKRGVILAVLLAAVPSYGVGQALQSPEQFLGYARGARFTDHANVVRYMEHVASSVPDRVSLRRYGETMEGRPLVQVVVARPDVLRDLSGVLDRNRRLADPSTPESEAQQIAASNPAVVYLSYGVHGNESSSSEAAMWTAWDLARGAEDVAWALDSVVVVIDPAVNPDGRDRYVDFYKRARGVEPNPDGASWEHREPWPGGRYNHYLFDLNRDWAWATQPETRARLATWAEWTPEVHVDFHEMGSSSTYFFFPPATPINPIFPDYTLDWADHFGRANAAAFDAEGWEYYTRESFDLFYPGYGDSWPSLNGAIGMTYEQAGGGRAGLVLELPDGRRLTLAERAAHHWVAGKATVRAAASSKTRFLRDFAAFHRRIDAGLPAGYLIVPVGEGAADRADALVALLQDEGIAVERAGRAFRAEATAYPGYSARRDFPAGTYLVRTRQPRGRLAAALLQPEAVLEGSFSYDISAWSLPYAYGVEAHSVERAPDGGWEAAPRRARDFDDVAMAGGGQPAAQPYGYLVRPGLHAWKGLVAFLEAGGRAVALEKPFNSGGVSWPAGTFFLPRAWNDDLADRVARAGLVARATAVATGLVEDGNDLGTEERITLTLPKVAVLTGEGVSPTSFGAHWYFLERTLGLDFDAVPTDAVSASVLEDYDVVVAPDMRRPPSGLADALKAWVEQGGTLVAVGSAARSLGGTIAGIEVREQEAENGGLADALRGREQREEDRWREDIPGTILPVTLDPANPLAYGYGAAGMSDRAFVLHMGDLAFEPKDDFESVAFFPEGMSRISGVIGEANLSLLSQSAWLATKSVRGGRVILFADDPLFRHFWYAEYQPYVNALMIGPAM